jgi:DNA helicase-2/ATP-dependent DNA helicase PcrA
MEDAPTALLADLNPAQRAAAEAVRGPVCILAGAGTGKTRTITYRIAHQVATGTARADQVLAVTFTERAAVELRARLATLGIGAPIRAATFHAAAWAQLRWFWPRCEGGPLPQVLASKVGLLARSAHRLGCQPRDLAAEIEWAKARRLDPETYAAQARTRQGPVDPDVMAEVYDRYEREKTAAGAIDYEDMLVRMITLLERPEVAEEVQARYRFFTVDEFQDVNPAQWALLRGWLGDSDELCVVGDDDQTIFSFTGASSGYLTNFRRHFPNAKVVTLTENYRSTPEILELANRILTTKPLARRKRLVAHTPVDRGSGGGPPTDRGSGGGPTTDRGSRPVPVFREFDDADTEVRAVVARVRALIDDGVPAGEIAICYRVNAQSEPFEKALSTAGIPYVVRGDGGFFDRPEIRQALTALRTAAERAVASSEEPLQRPEPGWLAQPKRADREVERVLRDRLSWHPRREPAGEAARERWRNLGALLEIATAAVDEQPQLEFTALVAALWQRAATGLPTPGGQGVGGGSPGGQGVGGGSPGGQGVGGGSPGGQDQAVTLLTLHRAKGTEFDTLFLVALEEGLLPISHARGNPEIEEERRLLYVGVTRARRHLWLSWARSRPGWRGTPQPRRPSRFLYNLSKDAPQRGTKRKDAPTKGMKANTVSNGRVDSTLEARLRAWRLQRAQRDGVPAYVIFPDSTLRALVAQRPGTLRELEEVRGLGPTRVERYGSEVLEVLAGG